MLLGVHYFFGLYFHNWSISETFLFDRIIMFVPLVVLLNASLYKELHSQAITTNTTFTTCFVKHRLCIQWSYQVRPISVRMCWSWWWCHLSDISNALFSLRLPQRLTLFHRTFLERFRLPVSLFWKRADVVQDHNWRHHAISEAANPKWWGRK